MVDSGPENIIADIELKDIKDFSDNLVFPENIENTDNQEIKREDLEKWVNDNLEELWESFLLAEGNKENLKKIDFSEESWKTEAENIFDTWIDNNSQIVQKLILDVFFTKNIDKKKAETLKKYITSEKLNLKYLAVEAELKNLQKDVNNPEIKGYATVADYSTYELLNSDETAWSMKKKFEQAMKNVPAKEKITFKEFSENIAGVVDAYFSDLDFVDPNTLKSMRMGVQFALMNSLKNTGDTDFFDIFNKTSGESKKGALLGLAKAFQKGKDYLNLWLKLENLKAHLQENRSNYKNCSGLQELTNPVNFMTTLEWSAFEQKETISLTAWEPTSMTEEQEDKLKSIANSFDLDKDKILKINASTKKAQELLKKRGERKKDISWLYSSLQDTVGWIMEPLEWVLGAFWMWGGSKYLIDMLGESNWFVRKVVDFFLGLIGFPGWLEGVHKDYITKNINKWIEINPKKKEFITWALEHYQTNKVDRWEIQENTFDKITTLKVQKEADDKLTVEEKKVEWWKVTPKFTDKIQENYGLLKQSIINSITKNSSALNPEAIKWLNGVSIKNKTVKIINKSNFADAYLQKMIPKLAENNKFMNAISSPDDFAFALFGNLTLDHFFIEGVKLGIVNKKDYWGKEEEKKTEEWKKPNKKEIKQLDNNFSEAKQKQVIASELEKAPFTTDEVRDSCKEYWVPPLYVMAFMKNDSSYWTAWKGARTYNPWNVGNTDNWSTKNFWDWRKWIDAVSKNMQWRIGEYRKVYWYLSVPTVKELADNIWPDGKGFLSSQDNYKQENTERKWAYMTAKNWWDAVLKIYNQYLS